MKEGRLRCLIGLILLSLCVAAAVGSRESAVGSRELLAQTVIATVPVGTQPIGVGINPNTNRVYVANQGSANVSVIDDISSIPATPTPTPKLATLTVKPGTAKRSPKAQTATVTARDQAGNGMDGGWR